LEGVNFTNAFLEGADLTSAYFDINTKFDGADLKGAKFTGAHFNGAVFDKANNIEKAIDLPKNTSTKRSIRNVSRIMTRKNIPKDIERHIQSYLVKPSLMYKRKTIKAGKKYKLSIKARK